MNQYMIVKKHNNIKLKICIYKFFYLGYYKAMQNNNLENKIAFITSLYQEDCFTSGGVKLNYLLLKYFKEKDDFIFDVYAKDYDAKVSLPDKIYPYEIFNETVAKKYKLVLSEKGILGSDVTYLHDHSNKFRNKFMYKKWYYNIIYKIISRKKYLERKKIDEIIQKHLKNTKKIIVSSNILKEDCIHNYKIEASKIHIIPPPVDYEPIKHVVKNEKFIFGISATGFERKGGYFLLKAVAKLKKQKYSNFKVKIILKKENLYIKFLTIYYGISKYIEFLPIQKNMCDFYDSIDCLVMPSILEPFGMVATEAMMNSKPVIVSKIAGVSDIIKDGVNGFISNNKNLDQKMQQMIDISNDDYKKMSKNAYNSVVDFTCENFAKKYLEILPQ